MTSSPACRTDDSSYLADAVEPLRLTERGVLDDYFDDLLGGPSFRGDGFRRSFVDVVPPCDTPDFLKGEAPAPAVDFGRRDENENRSLGRRRDQDQGKRRTRSRTERRRSPRPRGRKRRRERKARRVTMEFDLDALPPEATPAGSFVPSPGGVGVGPSPEFKDARSEALRNLAASMMRSERTRARVAAWRREVLTPEQRELLVSARERWREEIERVRKQARSSPASSASADGEDDDDDEDADEGAVRTEQCARWTIGAYMGILL